LPSEYRTPTTLPVIDRPQCRQRCTLEFLHRKVRIAYRFARLSEGGVEIFAMFSRAGVPWREFPMPVE
jgi:hypothetical protein